MGTKDRIGLEFLMDVPSQGRVLRFGAPNEGAVYQAVRGGELMTLLKSFPERHFDAVVAIHLETMLDDLRIEDFIAAAGRVLKPSGSLLMTIRNKRGYDNLMRRTDSLKRISQNYFRRCLRAAGFLDIKRYSLHPDIEKVSEVMGLGTRPYWGAITAREALKERIFANRFFPNISAGHAFVACKEQGHFPFVETLLNVLKPQLDMDGSLEKGLIIKRCYITRGKIVLLIGSKDPMNRSWAVKLPLRESSVRSLKNESKILKRLHASELGEKILAPKFVSEDMHQGHPYFVTQGMEGIAADLPVSSMRHVIEDGAKCMTRFHQETVLKRVIDEELYERFFSGPFEKIYDELGSRAKSLRRVEQMVKARVMGQSLPLVWEHGDLYHENLLFDPVTYKVCAVIDWEMSREEGLPLLDFLYLICDCDMLFRSASLEAVMIDKILPERFESFEKNLLDHYLKVIRISRELVLPLAVVMWIIRLNRSGGIGKKSTQFMESFDGVISAIETLF